MYKTLNPTAVQSQSWLVNSLLSLMKVKPYKAITIKEISENADLDRSTFYRNFDSKEDVLNYYIEDLAQEYIKDLSVNETLNMSTVAKIFFKFCNNNISFISMLKNNGLSNLILEKFNQYLPYIHKIYEKKFSNTISTHDMDYVLAFNAGGAWNVLMKWIDDGLIQSYDEIAKIFERVMMFDSLE